jgi:predicted nucleic acid-binding protein
VSVISVAELELGVLLARDSNARAARLRTLGEAFLVDERTASAYAELAAGMIAAGRTPRVNDSQRQCEPMTTEQR